MHALVLGVTGMLGSMVYDYLSRNPAIRVMGTARIPDSRSRTALGREFAFDAAGDIPQQLEPILATFRPDYVINCIGIINIHCRDSDPAGVLLAVRVNALFPHLLSDLLRRAQPGTKVLHITTDCVFSGRTGHYDESALHDATDMYGKSKSLGEVQADSWLNLRCSIVGPEPYGRNSLLEWFLRHPPETAINGFSHHLWNGVSTLQYAKFFEEIIIQDDFDRLRGMSHTLHYAPNEAVTKCELLELFNEVFARRCRIERVAAPGPPVDRTLVSNHLRLRLNPMGNAIRELKDYCDRVSFGFAATLDATNRH